VQPNLRPNNTRQPSDDLNELFSDGLGMDEFEIPPSPPADLDLSGSHPFDMRYNNGSYHRSNSLSVSQTAFHNSHHHPYHHSSSSISATTSTMTPSGTNHFKSNPLIVYDLEIDMNEIPTMNQQPLALGFYVSTIGTLNPLPSWMLSNGHRLQQRSTKASSVFKATLHINVPNAQHTDEMLFAHNHEPKATHPLDSNYTYVVLRQETSLVLSVTLVVRCRHVLECYNRLSWLLIDMKSNERASCLPIHLETLLRLYQAFVKFV
jgi:hypothetical protein